MKNLFLTPNLSLEDVREALPNRLRSYQEKKAKAIRDEILGETNGQASPPNRKHNLAEIEEKVKRGLDRARTVVGSNDRLLNLVDNLETLWGSLRDQLLIVSVGLSAMNGRTEAQIVEQLTQYQESLERVATDDSWSVSGVVGNC